MNDLELKKIYRKEMVKEAPKLAKALTEHKNKIIKAIIDQESLPTTPLPGLPATNTMIHEIGNMIGTHYMNKQIIGTAVADGKKGELCLVESSLWVDRSNKKPMTRLYRIYEDVKKGDTIYDYNVEDVNNLCLLFFEAVKEFKLSPEKLTEILTQKHTTERILNN